MMTAPATAVPDRPFPGIEAFGYSDHAVFFAREEESDKLLRLVTVYRGVLVYGPSGAGKSSLLNAGFIPRALAEGYTADRMRLQPRPGQEVIVERISLQAEARPPFLNSTFAADNDSSSRHVFSIADFRTKLAAATHSHPILIFDQLEEFISLFEEAPRGDGLEVARRVQADLLDLLVSLYRDADLRVKLLFVFREDYLAKLGKLFVHCPDLRDIFLHLTAPRPAALERIILGPFRSFPGRFGREFPEPLAKRLQFAFEERSDSSELNLSEVQIACQRLWRSTDPGREFAQKGLQGLLEDYLADSLSRLPADLRDPAVALLSRMVTEGGLRNVISEDDLIGRVMSEEGLRRPRLESALASLVADTRLVRRERREDVVFFEIVSEFLVPWIGRQKAARQARRQRRRFAAAAAVLLFVTVTSLTGTTWILRQRTEAAIARDEVKRAREAERVAQTIAEDEQRAREMTETRLATAIIERNTALAERDAARKAPVVRPQPALQPQMDQLAANKQQLDAENARLVRNLRAAETAVGKLEQELKTLRAKTEPTREVVQPRIEPQLPPVPPQKVVLAGNFRPGELTLFTGAPPFDAAIACFRMETDAAESRYAGITVVALTSRKDAWQDRIGKAQEQLRRLAERYFREMRAPDNIRRQAAMDKALERALTDLEEILPEVSVLRHAGTEYSSTSYVRRFRWNGAAYEVRVEPRSPRDYRVVLFRP